jgi:UDP-N-acetylglucosamine:LPS N-acetylglucosamine transferase
MDVAVCADWLALSTGLDTLRTFLSQSADQSRAAGYGWAMDDQERDAAVRDHLKALDDELARLKKMEAAMDRRIEEAEEERQAIADKARRRTDRD